MLIRILEHSGVVLAGVIGFFVGLFAVAFAALMSGATGTPEWLIACGIVLVCAGAFYLFGLVERLFDTGLDKFTRGIFSTGVKATTASDAHDRRFKYAGRIAYFAGALAAFALSSVVEPAEIMEFF